MKKAGQPEPEQVDLGLVGLEELEPYEATLVANTGADQFIGYQQQEGEYTITQVLEKKMKGPIPLNEVKETIRKQLFIDKQNHQFELWLNEQYKKLGVRIYLDLAMKYLTTDRIMSDDFEEESEEDVESGGESPVMSETPEKSDPTPPIPSPAAETPLPAASNFPGES
jgi:hypothetical protein